MVEVCDFWQHGRNDLNATRPVSNNSGFITLKMVSISFREQMPRATYAEIIAFIPASTMHQLSLEVMEARDAGPFPVI